MILTQSSSQPTGRLDRAFARSVVVPMAVALALCLGMVLATVLWVAREQNRASVASTTKLLSQILEIRARNLGQKALDNAIWDDCFLHGHKQVDPAWLDENVGIWSFKKFGTDLTFIIGPGGRTSYGNAGGRRADGDVSFFLGTGFAPLLKASREASPSQSERHGFIQTRFGAGFMAIATIMPSDEELDLPPAQRSSLVFVRLIDASFLKEVSGIAGVEHLHLQQEPSEGVAATRALRSVDGALISTLLWQPWRPGDALCRRLLPLLGIFGGCLGLYWLLALRHLRTAARTLAASEARAQTLALHDTLTGLPNRSLFRERLTTALTVPGDTLALLYLDLDGFKEVNDSLGHAAGDELLRLVAARLLAGSAEGELVARLGGDEFAILAVGGGGQPTAEALAERLLTAFAQPIELDGQECRVGASIGIALAPLHGRTADELAKCADIALYEAKRGGRGIYSVFAPAMNERLMARMRLLAALRHALDAECFELVFQPQYELRSGQLVAVEALLRWTDPELGSVAPNVFIPLAEESGLILPIGAWVLREACAAAIGWPGLRVAVNLSPIQFRDPALVGQVEAILAETGLAPDRLELEITESALFAEPDKARSQIEALRALGVLIAMDDFGTGYSSLSQLSRFPVDTLKIDQSFVSQLGTGGAADLIVRAVLGLGEGLGVNVIAEGVETGEQLAQLCSFGCPEGQGYLLSRPIEAAAVTRLLHRKPDIPELRPGRALVPAYA